MAANTSTPKTISDVFGGLRSDAANVRLASEDDLSAEAKKEAGPIEWTGSAAMLPSVAELLDIPLPDVLVQFWEKANEVAAELKASKTTPGERTVTLKETQTEASFGPQIQLQFNGKDVGQPIQFKVVLPLTLKAATLVIENGEIVDMIAGQCEIDGQITVGSLSVAKLKSPITFALPGMMDR